MNIDGEEIRFLRFSGSEFRNEGSYIGGRLDLRWSDDWGGADTDLDLFALATGTDIIALQSIDIQSGGPGHNPYEWIGSLATFDILIAHRGGPEPDWIQLVGWGPTRLTLNSTGAGSIINPAESANPAMLAVGAAPWYNVNVLSGFSSRGPTPDGRIKPDVVAANCGPTSTGGEGFCGTSQSSPHVAGMVALARQRYPDYTPVQVASYLKENAEQRTSPDPNNNWGHGFFILPPIAQVQPPRPTLPGAPSIPSLAPGASSLTVSWQAPIQTGGATVTAYDLRHIRSDASSKADGNWTLVSRVWTGAGALSHTLNSLTGGVRYDVQVRAVNSAGDGPWSTTRTGTPIAAANAPGAPRNLIATGNGPARIDLSWSTPLNDGGAAVTGYRIEFSTDRIAWSGLLSNSGSTISAYSHSGLTAGSTRYYRVSAMNSAGTGPPSNIAEANSEAALAPDLAVDRPTVSASAPSAGERFSLNATVRNQGNGSSGFTTLRYYQSTDSAITSIDTAVGTDSVSRLDSSESGDESISLTAASTPGTYYYGACVDAVTDESDTTNNCSSAVTATVGAPPARGSDSPRGIWSDGTTMWVADSGDDKLYAYDGLGIETRVPAKDFDTLNAAGNSNPGGIWSDGTTMWVADSGDDKLYAYDMATKARAPGSDFDTLNAAGNRNPRGIWSDGTTMWVADSDDDKLYAYDMATKARAPGRDFDTLNAAGNRGPQGIWSDGTTMWVADDWVYRRNLHLRPDIEIHHHRVFAYAMASKVQEARALQSETLGAAGNRSPWGIWSDGGTIWVADHSDGKVYAYAVPSTNLPPTYNPTNQRYTRQGSTIVVSWDEVADADYYKVYYDDFFGSSCRIGSLGDPIFCEELAGNVNGTSYSHANPAKATDYYYWVTVCNEFGCTTVDSANPATFADSAPEVTTPAAPSTLTATVNGPTQIDLSWRAPSGSGDAAITGYRIEVSTDASNWSDLVANTRSSATSYPHVGLTASSTRHYRVSAINSAGTGPASNVANATTGSAATPDLVVDTSTVSNSAPDAGARITLSARVRNQGNGDAGVTTLRYYQSTDSTITTNDTEFDTDSVSPLDASESGDESVRPTAPSNPGTYYYGACVDSVTGESDTANNCSSAVTVTVGAAPAPDLVVDTPTVSESAPAAGERFTLHATVRNQGNGDAGFSRLRYYQSTDTSITAGDTEVGTDLVSRLDASESGDESVSLTAPSTPGSY